MRDSPNRSVLYGHGRRKGLSKADEGKFRNGNQMRNMFPYFSPDPVNISWGSLGGRGLSFLLSALRISLPNF
jgi:hypothetical protein